MSQGVTIKGKTAADRGVAIQVDDSGRLMIKLDDTVIVDGSAVTQPVSATDLDIRNLTSVSDSVEVKQATRSNLLANASIQMAGSDVTSANPVIATSPYLALRLDDSSTANVTYIGKAAIGTATSAASWQIFKLDESSGLSITWADGDANFNNIWNNRTGLTYS